MLNWLDDRCDLGKKFMVLEPERWFTQAHKPGFVDGYPCRLRPSISYVKLCTNALYVSIFSSPVVDDESLVEATAQGDGNEICLEA
jgi:hypothetical protein